MRRTEVFYEVPRPNGPAIAQPNPQGWVLLRGGRGLKGRNNMLFQIVSSAPMPARWASFQKDLKARQSFNKVELSKTFNRVRFSENSDPKLVLLHRSFKRSSVDS